MTRGNYTKSEFYCTECGRKGIPVMRKGGQQRAPGHLKKMYCIYCKKETNHAEVRPFGKYEYEDFLQEFELGRFVNGNKYNIADLKDCKNEQCKCCVNGKCWNSNRKNQCLLEEEVK